MSQNTEQIEEVIFLEDQIELKRNTYNGLAEESRIDIFNKFFAENTHTLTKYLGYFIKNKLTNSVFSSCEEIIIAQRNITTCDYHFGNNEIIAPKQFNLIGRIILEKSFNQNGLFRVNSTKQRLRTANSLLQDIVEQRVNEQKGIELFNKNFDLIDCCELYKMLLRSFNCTIIPYKYIDIILEIQMIEDLKDKMICTKAMYYSLPHNNRLILESNVMLCYKICLKTWKMDSNDKQMDLDGVSIVMMPNLFLMKDQDIEIEKVLVLVEFCKYFYKVFPEVCGV